MIQTMRAATRTRLGLYVLVSLAASTSIAEASSSDWAVTEGARLRLVTAGRPDADGILQGALQIDLRPGWKTYWRDPGSSGVPPSIDLAASLGAKLLNVQYPAPTRFDDESGDWVGYKHSVMFPLTIQLKPNSAIEADIFIGVCETICVPFQAKLSLDPASNPSNADDEAILNAALGVIPKPATSAFQAAIASRSSSQIQVEATIEADAESAELFLAAENGYSFGTPERAIHGSTTIFTVKVLDKPAAIPSGKGIFYTLSTNAGAVQGYLPFP